MLGTTLWFVVVMGLLAAVLMNGAAAFGRAGLQAAADHAVEAALHDALADYQNRLPAVLANGALAEGGALPVVSVSPAPRAAGDGVGDGLTVAYDVTPTTVTAPSCTTPEQDGADTVAWLQCSRSVRESRASLRLIVRVLDASGTQLLARREQTVTLRLFGLPPYSAVVGRADGAADDQTGADAPAAHEGDLAGAGALHVRFACGAGDCAGAAPPDPDADLRPGLRWTNGNAPAR